MVSLPSPAVLEACAGHEVVVSATKQPVGPRALQRIIARATFQPIAGADREAGAGRAGEAVVAVASDQGIGPATAREGVVARPRHR